MSSHRFLIVAVVGVFSSAHADTIYVDDDNCPGPGDGSQLNPYCSIQTAIDNAVDTDEIVVAPGTYYETINLLGKAVWLHSSDSTDLTIIDAQQQGSVVTCDSGEGSETVLEGFTITGGSADTGGGMYLYISSPTVINCTLSENTVAYYGGGMFTSFSSSTVANCTFSGNSALRGGGMANSGSGPAVVNCTFSGNSAHRGGGMANSGCSPTVVNCTFNDNLAGGMGGGMFNENSGPTMTDCTFSGNSAHGIAGGIANLGSSPTVTDCTFSGNSAQGSAGGMTNLASSPTVTGCTFSGNSASSGGGMRNASSNPTVTNCTFEGNTADQSGGGMMNSGGSSPTVTNCAFSGNTATNGKALALLWGPSELAMANCILWNGGDEIWNADGSALQISYTDVQGGFPGTGNIDADPLFVDPVGGDFRLTPGSPCIDAGDNTAVPEDITTDLDGNPRFLEIPETPDTGYGDPPIVDMGAYESLGGGCLAITNIETICHGDGTTFTVNVEGLNACTGGLTQATFTGSGGAVGEDLCATLLINTEQGGFCCSTQVCVPVPDCSGATSPCDLDGDGIVGVLDFLTLLNAWGPNAGHAADLNFDGEVGVGDFLILLAAWDE